MQNQTASKAELDKKACETASHFTKIYHEAVDRKRSKINFLYVDDATLVWNGNLVQGAENITKFYEALPISQHSISALDCHYMDYEEVEPYPLVVLLAGNVSLGGVDHAYTQTIILVHEDEKYKIKSDRFRFID
uniref:NTF2-related export protein n=1 Tax=Syphacia muris TaxID=451379 RepID=A0A0N5ADA2_9BILA